MVHVTNKVTVATPVEISCKIDTVVKESKVETKVELTLLLVGKVLVTELLIITSLLNRSEWTPRHCCCEDWQWVSYRRTVTSKWVTQAECSMCQRLLKHLIKPFFLMCIPCTRNVIGWQPTSWCSLTQIVSTLITESTSHLIATLIRIGTCTEVSKTANVGIWQTIVVRTLLLEHLECTIVQLGNLTSIKHHTPLTVESSFTVNAITLNTSIEVHDVCIIEYIVVSSRKTGIPTKEVVTCSVKNTTLFEDWLWQSKWIVRISIKIRIGIADSCCTHCTISQSLIRVFTNDMLHRWSSTLNSYQSCKLQLCNWLIVNTCLYTEIVYIQVHIVIVQLIEDIERSIVTCIWLGWVECTWSIQRVRVRVDIECTANRTSCWVNRTAQRTWSSLLTVRSISDKVQTYLLINVVSRVDVTSVTLNTAWLIPSRIIHRREWSIVLSLVCTTRSTHRVVVHDWTWEKLVEPVSIAILSSTQISVTCSLCILKTELSLSSIILRDELIHTTINTTCRGVSNLSIIQIALLL